MKDLLFVLATFALFAPVFANTGETLSSNENNGIDIWILRQENKELEYRLKDEIYDYYNKAIDSSNGVVNQGLATQTTILTVFWILLALGSIWIAWYFNGLFDKMKIMKEDVHEDLLEARRIKGFIDENPKLIYDRILEEETKYIFNRLETYPEDLTNFFSKLATRKLDGVYFWKLKKLFESVVDAYGKSNYLILILQHFPSNLFIWDDLLWGYFVNHPVLHSAFQKEKEDISVEISRIFIENPEKYSERYKEYLRILNARWSLSNDNSIRARLNDLFVEKWKEGMLNELINLILPSNNVPVVSDGSPA